MKIYGKTDVERKDPAAGKLPVAKKASPRKDAIMAGFKTKPRRMPHRSVSY